MSSIIDEPVHHEPVRLERPVLPSIGMWWPMLERPLQLEILEDLNAPLRLDVVQRILELCDRDGQPLPPGMVRLTENERAYIAGWTHAVRWD